MASPWRRRCTPPPIARLHFSTHESTCTRLYWCQHVLRRYLDGRPRARRARGAYNARLDPTLRFIYEPAACRPEITTSHDTASASAVDMHGMRTTRRFARDVRVGSSPTPLTRVRLLFLSLLPGGPPRPSLREQIPRCDPRRRAEERLRCRRRRRRRGKEPAQREGDRRCRRRCRRHGQHRRCHGGRVR